MEGPPLRSDPKARKLAVTGQTWPWQAWEVSGKTRGAATINERGDKREQKYEAHRIKSGEWHRAVCEKVSGKKKKKNTKKTQKKKNPKKRNPNKTADKKPLLW